VLVVLGLSSMLQVVAMAAPFYTQLVVDHVLTRNDRNLLLALACGFGLLMLIQTGITLLRDYTVLYLGNIVSFQMCANLLSHLIRLPLQYFERRHLGDVLSRFGSLGAIENLITTGFVSVVIDGVMAVLVLALMFAYSPALAAVALAAVVAYAVLRAALYHPLRQIREQAIVAQAKESTALIELLSGIQAVKLLSAEPQREAFWQNHHADSVNAGVRSARYTLGFQSANSVLFGVEQVLSIYLAAQLVLENVFSVGMLYAYLSYKSQFIARVGSLIDWVLRFRMLDVPLGRLADIVHTPQESGLRGAPAPHARLRGRIELRGVSFRYAESEPYVLRDVWLVIEEGSCVGIVGRSGSGKTTLLKLILGLLEPSEGEILIDGQKLGRADLAGYRRQVGAVMQEDRLFQGTIAENISAFDPDEDIRRVEAAARAACMHDDIARFPLGYATLINTMGSSLSGGQRQRVLLARVFYRQPRIVVLDEGTASLDPAAVEKIWTALVHERCTRIIASHQAFPANAVSAVLNVHEGRVVSSRVGLDELRPAVAHLSGFPSTATTARYGWGN
jgi:ATP-binding cassette subfamily B protein RaxB